MSCNGQCVDTMSHMNHCGGCNRPCNGGLACSNGQCGGGGQAGSASTGGRGGAAGAGGAGARSGGSSTGGAGASSAGAGGTNQSG
jgi:hypothetical protein